MRTIDDTDLEILRLLLEDARRPYNDIADRVDVSAPTVSDRIDRLQDLGVIEGFTVEVDRTAFTDGIELLIDVELSATVDRSIVEEFSRVDGIEHVFKTTDSRILAVAVLRSDQVGQAIVNAIDVELIDSYRVHLIEDRSWAPSIDDTELELSCAQCAEPVNRDGVSLRFDGELYHFCATRCRSDFEERYATLAKSA